MPDPENPATGEETSSGAVEVDAAVAPEVSGETTNGQRQATAQQSAMDKAVEDFLAEGEKSSKAAGETEQGKEGATEGAEPDKATASNKDPLGQLNERMKKLEDSFEKRVIKGLQTALNRKQEELNALRGGKSVPTGHAGGSGSTSPAPTVSAREAALEFMLNSLRADPDSAAKVSALIPQAQAIMAQMLQTQGVTGVQQQPAAAPMNGAASPSSNFAPLPPEVHRLLIDKELEDLSSSYFPLEEQTKADILELHANYEDEIRAKMPEQIRDLVILPLEVSYWKYFGQQIAPKMQARMKMLETQRKETRVKAKAAPPSGVGSGISRPSKAYERMTPEEKMGHWERQFVEGGQGG